jgi:hypothetical protein
MNKRPATVILSILCASAALICRCTLNNLSGGGTEDVNTLVVMGMVLNPDNTPGARAQVMLIPADFDPLQDSRSAILIDTTNRAGEYRFTVQKSGLYTTQIVQTTSRTRAIVARVAVGGDTTVFPPAGLSKPGVLKILLPDSTTDGNGYLYVPGTTISAWLSETGSFTLLDSVPAGTLPSVNLGVPASVSRIIRHNVPVSPAETTTVALPAWKYAARLALNTSPAGAGVSGNVMNFPVLVRLNNGNFFFGQSLTNGDDIRFAKKDGSPLNYEIERWDPAAGFAELWVRVDTVFGNDSSQVMDMYWGNPAAANGSSSAAVFDTASGFAGVWHLGRPVGSIIPDATVNGNSGTAIATTMVPGAVGMAQLFDGTSSLVRASGPGVDKLNFPENGTFSVSAWVKTNVLDSIFHGIVYKSNEQYGLQMRPKNEWEFYTYFDKSRWEMSRSPASDNLWHTLTGVRNGSKQYLYVDGRCLDSSIVTLSTYLVRVTDQPLEIGHCPDGGDDPDRFFNGVIDEVRISNRAYSADWIKLCYMNQKVQDELVKW